MRPLWGYNMVVALVRWCRGRACPGRMDLRIRGLDFLRWVREAAEALSTSGSGSGGIRGSAGSRMEVKG